MSMNTDPLQMLHKGLRITLGATSSLAESIQDPQKREETLAQIRRMDLNELSEAWAQKGEVTEQEALNLIQSVTSHSQNPYTSAPAASTASQASASSVVTSTLQLELQELTAQLAAIRTELAGPKDLGA